MSSHGQGYAHVALLSLSLTLHLITGLALHVLNLSTIVLLVLNLLGEIR